MIDLRWSGRRVGGLAKRHKIVLAIERDGRACDGTDCRPGTIGRPVGNGRDLPAGLVIGRRLATEALGSELGHARVVVLEWNQSVGR